MINPADRLPHLINTEKKFSVVNNLVRQLGLHLRRTCLVYVQGKSSVFYYIIHSPSSLNYSDLYDYFPPNLSFRQGDQIGRILAYWFMYVLLTFFENDLTIPKIWATFLQKNVLERFFHKPSGHPGFL
jgi:hypothetical protein